MDPFGMRPAMALALAATACGVATCPATRTEWQLVLLWGVGIGFIGAYLAACITARWFRKRQGPVIGAGRPAPAAAA